MPNLKRAVFLDRDGTIVKAFPGRPANNVDEIELLPGAANGLLRVKEAGLIAVMVSNQGGIALGHMENDTMKAMNERLNDLLIKEKSPTIDAFYWCPHAPNDRCECRKPRPGMILQAAKEIGIDLAKSYFVGDDVRDMDAAVCAGVKWPLMVVSDRYQDTPFARMVFPTFRDAAKAICILEAYSG